MFYFRLWLTIYFLFPPPSQSPPRTLIITVPGWTTASGGATTATSSCFCCRWQFTWSVSSPSASYTCCNTWRSYGSCTVLSRILTHSVCVCVCVPVYVCVCTRLHMSMLNNTEQFSWSVSPVWSWSVYLGCFCSRSWVSPDSTCTWCPEDAPQMNKSVFYY